MNVITLLAISWQEVTGWMALLNMILIGITLLSVLSIKKDSVSAVSWCLTVILMPVFGIFLYWVIGYQNVHRPLKRKRRHALSFRKRQPMEDVVAPASNAEETTLDVWRDLSRLATRLGASPSISGNAVDLYHGGQAAFDAMLEAIRSAKNHIHLEFFIFRADESGKQFIEAMVERARAGVQVRFLYDAVGSWSLHRQLLQQLTDAGGKVSAFLTLLNPLRRRIQINLRNHRKILIVDGKIGFTGGFNIGDEYLGKNPFFGAWRDTFLRLEGPGVRWMQRVFMEDWNFATEEELSGPSYLPNIRVAGNVVTQIAWSGPDQEIRTIREIYFAAIMRAQQRIWIASPYFVPDAGLLDAVCLAARSGRDVRLIMPFRPDKWVPFLAARYYWQDVLAAGVKVYQYTEGFMHAKIWIADDSWASVGSANFDNRSLLLNFEITCLLESKEIVVQLEEKLLKDMSASILLDHAQFENRGFVSRIAENTCRLLSPVL